VRPCAGSEHRAAAPELQCAHCREVVQFPCRPEMLPVSAAPTDNWPMTRPTPGMRLRRRLLRAPRASWVCAGHRRACLRPTAGEPRKRVKMACARVPRLGSNRSASLMLASIMLSPQPCRRASKARQDPAGPKRAHRAPARQLAGTVTTGAGERTPTSEVEKHSMTPEKMACGRLSVSTILNPWPL
jgi:hypothetical protein